MPFHSLTKFLTQIFYTGACLLRSQCPHTPPVTGRARCLAGSVARIPAQASIMFSYASAGSGGIGGATAPHGPPLINGDASFAKMCAQKFRNVRSMDVFQFGL